MMKRFPFTPTPEVWMQVRSPKRLRDERRRAGYTQDDLAALVKVTQQYISLLETGRDRDCSDEVAHRICRYLGLAREDLFIERPNTRVRVVTTRSRVAGSAA